MIKIFLKVSIQIAILITTWAQGVSPLLAIPNNAENLIQYTLGESTNPSKKHTDEAVLKDVLKQMAPAITNFLTTYSFTKINAAESYLESKYSRRVLAISWNISDDAKMFLVVSLSGKRYCYEVKGDYSAQLVKSSRCS
jgi:hypothetical protein